MHISSGSTDMSECAADSGSESESGCGRSSYVLVFRFLAALVDLSSGLPAYMEVAETKPGKFWAIEREAQLAATHSHSHSHLLARQVQLLPVLLCVSSRHQWPEWWLLDLAWQSRP